MLEAVKAGEMTERIRTSLAWVLQQLIEAELTATIGASAHERTETRIAQRNGHRPKLITTTAGDVELHIPKLREGSFFPSLLERRRRIDRALSAVVMEAWVHGVSTRAGCLQDGQNPGGRCRRTGYPFDVRARKYL